MEAPSFFFLLSLLFSRGGGSSQPTAGGGGRGGEREGRLFLPNIPPPPRRLVGEIQTKRKRADGSGFFDDGHPFFPFFSFSEPVHTGPKHWIRILASFPLSLLFT